MSKIIQWNCQGYRSKYEDLKLIIYQENPAAVLLQETMLSNHNFRPPSGYSIYCDYNNPLPGNGLATLIRNDVPHHRLDLQTNLQATSFRIGLRRQYTICNIYIPPNNRLSLDDITTLIDQLPSPVLVCGDFNSRNHLWDPTCARSDARALTIERALLLTSMTLLNTGNPTHFYDQNGSFSAIDLTMCSAEVHTGFTWSTIDDLHGSDHYPIRIHETVAALYSSQV